MAHILRFRQDIASFEGNLDQMPALDNPRHERFAQELAKGKTADEAYVNAGYAQNDGNCSRLKGNERIVNRVHEIMERGAIRAEVTVQSLLEESEQVRVAAMASGQYAAAMAAIREKGVLSGKRIERSEGGNPGEFEEHDATKLLAEIRSEAAALGIPLTRELTH